MPQLIVALRDERAPVEALVILDAHEKAPGKGRFPYLLGMLELLHQRLHAENVLVAPERFHDNLVMHLVRHGHNRHLPRRHFRQHPLVQVGVVPVRRPGQVRVCRERLVGKGLLQIRVVAKDFERSHVQGADPDLSNRADPLEMIDRGQEQIVRNHAPADNDDIKCFHGRPFQSIAGCRTNAGSA